MEKQIGLGSGTGFWLMDMYFENILVTPECAEKILNEYNSHNRDVNNIHINFLADQMSRQMWIERTGVGLFFDKNMNLVDGQQRLRAVIESKKTINFLVVSNVDEKAFLIYDTQRTRTAADSFKIRGYLYHAQLAAITKRYMVLVRNSTDYNSSSKRLKITANEQLAEYEINKDHWDSILQIGIKLNSFQNVLTTTDYVGFISYLIRHKGHNIEKVISFFNKFSGIEKCDFETIEEVRRRLTNARNMNRTKKGNKRSGLSDSLKTSYIAIAWNSYITNKKNDQGLKFEDGEYFI